MSFADKVVAAVKSVVAEKPVVKKVVASSLPGQILVCIKLPKVIPVITESDGYIVQNEYKPPQERILVMSATNQDNSIYLSHIAITPGDAKAYPRGVRLPKDLEVEVLEDEEALAFKNLRADFMFQNLPDHLNHGFMIGSDPEIFARDENDKMIPSFLFLGSKENPDITPGSLDEYNAGKWDQYSGCGGNPMYWDGFQGEFATKPNLCLELHTDSIASGLRGLIEKARTRFPGAKLSLVSVEDIDPEILGTADEAHVAFGCMPSYNAYGMSVMMPPAREVPFRSAGGHIHFGIGRIGMEGAIPIVKTLDAILGVACVSLFANWDDPKRRVLYGLPGEFRLPPHGMEYRPLSNAWMAHPFLTNFVLDFSRKVVVFGQLGLLNRWKAEEKETINTIIRCDVNKSREILERNKPLFQQLLKASYAWADQKDLDLMFNIWMTGLEAAIEDPKDFDKNWNLKNNTRVLTKNVTHSMELLRRGKKL